jgi:hypothetical protein
MSPTLLFSVLLAGMVGLLAHATLGRYLWQLPVYLIAAFVGVFGGEIVAAVTGSGLLRYGSVPVGTALIGAGAMVLLAWLFTVRAVIGNDRTVAGYEDRAQAEVGVQE